MNQDNVIYFNNCKGRDQVAIYGPGAFFDLDDVGRQSKQALDLPVGQECVVASYGADGRIIFDWYTLDRETKLQDKSGNLCRVFFGKLLSTEALTKSKAIRSKRYSAFFSVSGHFKRHSVVHGDVKALDRPRDKGNKATSCPEEVDPSGGPFVEGATRRIMVNAYERNAAARDACIQQQGTACCICGFDFGKAYGPEAKGYIHVHHVKPLAEIKSTYEINPKTDLRPVCPNCHSVLHLGGVLRSIEEVKAMRSSGNRGE
jgi:predicted HNH restriction endonuclease